MSEELLSDRPEMRARMDGSLTQQMLRRVQSDIMGGAPIPASEYVGTPTNSTDVVGFLDVPNADINLIDGNAGANSGEFRNPITVIEEAVEMIYRVGEAEADAVVMNSQDWVRVKTLQATTGAFILRGALAPISQAVPRAIDEWPVILCNALPEHTMIVGAFGEHCAIRDRQSLQVRIQEALSVPVAGANVTVHTEPTGRFNIYADARYAFYVRRGLAFTRVTDFTNPA